MNHYSVNLPTKAYLCRYVQAIYGHEIDKKVIIDPQTDFGDLIFTKMASNIHCNLSPCEVNSKLSRMPETLQLKIPMHWFRKLPVKDLSPHQIIRINRHLENLFEKDLCDIVSRAHDIMGIDRKTAIECFAVNHGIQLEYDITFDGLKQMEFRYRKKNARHTVRKKIVQELSCKMRAA
jgi:hypothetical protein